MTLKTYVYIHGYDKWLEENIITKKEKEWWGRSPNLIEFFTKQKSEK
jgi:hypothetical protein